MLAKPMNVIPALVIVLAMAGSGYFLGRQFSDPQSQAGTWQIGQNTLNVDLPDLSAIPMTSSTGQEVTWGEFSGHFRLVFFGYTFCPDICPLGLSNMVSALDLLQERNFDPLPIFVTVDPERDTPDVVRQYVDAFHDNLVGLVGHTTQTRKLASGFRAIYERADDIENSEFYLINHTSYIYLIGPNGDLLDYYDDDIQFENLAATIFERIQQL